MLIQKLVFLGLIFNAVHLLCLPKTYLEGLGFVPLEKLQTGEEWKFCPKYFTESGLCVEEDSIKEVVETLQKTLLESQFKSMSGFDRIIPKMYSSIKSIRERLQNLYKVKIQERSKINNFSKRIWELIEKNKTSGHIIKEIAYFEMTTFIDELNIAVSGQFTYDDYQAHQATLSDSSSHTPNFDNWSQHQQRLSAIELDINDKITKLQEKRYVIRGKIFRNEAKINALVAKNEIVPGFPLKGAPDLTVTQPVTEETTDTETQTARILQEQNSFKKGR
jgi:DNA-binding ferritin-like protein (Dps family)